MRPRQRVLFILLIAGCSQSDDYRKGMSSDRRSKSTPANVEAVVKPDDSTASEKYFKNEEYGFSIALPEGWGPISFEALKSQSEAVSGPNLRIDYIAGYQVLQNDPFVHPFILVRRLPDTMMPKSQLKPVTNLFESRGDQLAKYVENQSDLDVNLDLGIPMLESETGIVWLKFQLDGLDGQRVEGLMAHYYVDESILQFNAGTTAGRGKEDWPILQRALRTIKLE